MGFFYRGLEASNWHKFEAAAQLLAPAVIDCICDCFERTAHAEVRMGLMYREQLQCTVGRM